MPDGLSASEGRAQKNEKQAKVQNKAKYPKGAPQVPARRVVSFFVPGSRRYRRAVRATAPSRGVVHVIARRSSA